MRSPSKKVGGRRVRVGVVGVGRMGAVHARLLADHPDVEELAILDRDAHRADTMATRLAARRPSSVEALLREVDAVVVASATPSHAQLVEQAVQADVPVLCEKPLAADLASTDQLMAVIEGAGGKVQVGFHRRFDPRVAAARRLVAAGGLGRLYLLRANSYDAEPPPEAFVPSSGGMYADVQIHDFDLVRFLSGDEIVEVHADGSVLIRDYFERHDDVDVAVVVLRLVSGALALASATRHSARGYDARVELVGSRDSVVVGWDERLPIRPVESTTVPADAPYRDFIDRFLPAYRAELDAFLAYAGGESDNPVTPRDARAAMRVVAACDASRRQHRPVRIEEMP